MHHAKLKRILVMDDEHSIRTLMLNLLSLYYEVRTISSGKELAEALKTFEPDLAIFDVDLPEENGWDLCARLRKNSHHRDLPIVFLSAISDAASVRKGYSNGGDCYLTKPFELAQLLRVIDTLLGQPLSAAGHSALHTK